MKEEIEHQRELLGSDTEPELQLIFSLKPGYDRNRYNLQRTNRRRNKALSQLEQRRRYYLGASSEEGAISARVAKKALFRHELRRRRYLGANSKKALSQAGFFFSNFVVALACVPRRVANVVYRNIFFKLETMRVSKFLIT